MQKSEIEALLRSLRHQALTEGADKLGSHQLDAHWSLAFACNRPPEPWEMYRVPTLHLMPSTDFFVNHPREIQEALKPRATWEFLRVHAVEKIAFEARTSESERKAHGYPGKVQYYDTNKKGWVSIDVPRIQWFDARDVFRESVTRTKEEYRASVDQRLAKLRQEAKDDPTPKRPDELAAYEKYVAGQFLVNLTKFEAQKKSTRAWVAKLDTTCDFGKALFTLLRETENDVRKARGISAVGEAWVSETELLYRVRELLCGVEVIAHGQPKWLGRQHLDIWIPSHSVAIEYHGLQHFQSVEFFGGEDAFRRVQERDNRKRSQCEKNKVRLVEIAYDQDIDDTTLKSLIFVHS
ncbi:MAG: hypothetical protein WBF43_03940 [Methylocella sp.]